MKNYGESFNYGMGPASITGFASSITSVPTRAGCLRRVCTRSERAHVRAVCALARWVTLSRCTLPCAWQKGSHLSITCSVGGWSCVSFPESMRIIFARSDSIMISASRRRSNLSITCVWHSAGRSPFSFHGNEFHTASAEISVQPFQRPHPPLWMMSRDPRTLEFCARNAISPGYFLIYPRSDAAPRYRKFLEDWNKAGWLQKPNIAYCTIVHVDETDEKAIKAGLFRASRAYEGFLPPAQPGETFDERVRTHAKKFIGRGEPGASEIMANLFDPDYLMQHELVFIGSPETVAKKIHDAAKSGLFNTFMGEFNFSDQPESDLMRSIRLFGEKVIPALRAYEPF